MYIFVYVSWRDLPEDALHTPSSPGAEFNRNHSAGFLKCLKEFLCCHCTVSSMFLSVPFPVKSCDCLHALQNK